MFNTFLKSTIYIVFSLSLKLSYCQTNSALTPKQPHNKLQIGLQLAPKYSYRTLSSNLESAQFVVDSRNENEFGIIAKNFGISADYFFKKKLGIGISILYSQNGEQTQKSSNQTATNMGFTKPTQEYWFKFNYNYVELPIKFYGVLMDREKFSIHTSIGINNNFFLNEKQTVYTRDIASNKTTHSVHTSNTQFNPYALSFIVATGIDFNFNSLKIRVQPSYDRFITSATYGNLQTYYYNVSLVLGVFYSF